MTCFATNFYFGLLEIQSLTTFCKFNTLPFLCQVVFSIVKKVQNVAKKNTTT